MKHSSAIAKATPPLPNYPVLLGAGFLFLSLSLYWFYFPEDRNLLVLTYVVINIFALLLGSYLGGKVTLGSHATVTLRFGWLWLACLLLVVVSTVNITSFYSSISDIFAFLLEPGEAYEYVKFSVRTGQGSDALLGGRYGPLITMLAFTKYVVFGWTALYWRQLSKSLRLASVTSMLYYTVQAILLGAMVNVATVLLSTTVIFVVKGRQAPRRNGSRIFWWSVLSMTLGLTILSYFRGSREAGVTGFRDRLVVGAEGLISYVSHGYVGLGYTMEQPFVFTGGKTALYGFARLFTGSLPPESYLVRSEAATGWSATTVWSTAAPWLASDITFLGVPLVLLLLGIWAGRLWKRAYITLDPLALLLLGQLTIAIFFFPANNHLLHTFASASGFVIIVLLYMVSRWRGTGESVGDPNQPRAVPTSP